MFEKFKMNMKCTSLIDRIMKKEEIFFFMKSFELVISFEHLQFLYSDNSVTNKYFKYIRNMIDDQRIGI